jgi:hypothetical protein
MGTHEGRRVGPVRELRTLDATQSVEARRRSDEPHVPPLIYLTEALHNSVPIARDGTPGPWQSRVLLGVDERANQASPHEGGVDPETGRGGSHAWLLMR